LKYQETIFNDYVKFCLSLPDNKRWLKCLFEEMDNNTIQTIFNFDIYYIEFFIGTFEVNSLRFYDNAVTLTETNMNFVIYNDVNTSCIQQVCNLLAFDQL
jgi:hypothetical protein